MVNRLKIEGPAICHIFFDSDHVLLTKLELFDPFDGGWFSSRLEVIRGTSSAITKIADSATEAFQVWLRT